MTIKKPMNTAGSAAIASRLRLDTPDAKKSAPQGKGLTFAFAAALIALAVVGGLTYLLWKHWEYLMPA